MALELLAIWLIVAATIILFIRDERRRRLVRLAKQAHNFATAPAWRHREAVASAPERPMNSGELTVIQRRFAEELRRLAH